MSPASFTNTAAEKRPAGGAHSPLNSQARPGYNGQLHEPGGCLQFLGSGHRVFNPSLMRFQSPDGRSPFAEGGINCYAYCSCDPVNNADPTGQFLVPAALLMGIGAVGVGALAAALGVQGKDKEARILGAIAGALGVASMVTGGVHAFRARRPVRTGARVKDTNLGHGEVVIWRTPDRDIVRVHARRGQVELRPGQPSTGKDLARVYMGTPMGKSRQVPVELQACYGGLGGHASVGQAFANAANVPVTAYADVVKGLGGVKQLTATSQPVVFHPNIPAAKAASAGRFGDLDRRAGRLRSQQP